MKFSRIHPARLIGPVGLASVIGVASLVDTAGPPPTPPAPRQVDKIIVHCSATPEGRDVTVEDIDLWHRRRGFLEVGYHYVVSLDGTVHPARDEQKTGAHTLGHNAHSIGICYIGGTDTEGNPKDTRTPAQRESLLRLLLHLTTKYPDATIHGHNEFAATSCPCFDVSAEYGSY